jgi:transcriptional regulator with PAS, ATPase and Fis domain
LSTEYDWSPSHKAVQTRSTVTGVVGTKYGKKQVVNCTPIFDEKGEVSLVIVTALDKEIIDRYKEVLTKDNSHEESYKITIDYLSESNFSDKAIVAESPQMVRVLNTSKIVAKTDSTVMLIGESGTGKEVIARYIHRNSLRAQEAFIPVNCAAIPQELMESEFFGYVKGAFTGANMQGKAGLFEIADHGTLFLDEIAELPLNMQSKLLRVLETGEIKRLGDTRTKKVNVRLIAATNRDLKEMINQNLFRSDLYFRLNVIPITLPNLRNRPDDILPLAYSILKELMSIRIK